MNRPSPRLLCQIYGLLVLLTASVISPLPYSLLALGLLVVMLLTTLRHLPPGSNATITIATIFLAPLALAALLANLTPTAAAILATALMAPVFYLLDDNLRQSARHAPALIQGRRSRHATSTLATLLAAALVMMLLSPVVNHPVLLFTGIAIALYLLGVLVWIYLTMPPQPLTTPTISKRIIAGTTGRLSVTIKSRAPATMYGYVTPADTWVKATPQRLTINKGKTELDLSFTPPLAGPARPELRVAAIDGRGLIQINQSLEPLHMDVIPRARYAIWLAHKYLEPAEAAPALATPPVLIPRRGAEYRDSRTYQPGDRLKDIDWKHTLKLRQLIIKEFIEAGEPAAIIAVNLAVTDAEAADKLAFNLITVALTLAQENIPAALAAYNHQSVILKTAITSPTEILRQAMSLVREITLVKLAARHLEAMDIAQIRRNITRLQEATSEPARRLLGLLSFEYSAIEKAARNHPATLALSATAKNVPAPALILLVSQLNHDAEALGVTLARLSRRRFTTLLVAAAI